MRRLRRHGDTGITDTQAGMALGYGRVSFFRYGGRKAARYVLQ